MKWISIKDAIPPMGIEVLCYWDSYGEDVFLTCELTNRNGITMFQGSDIKQSQEDVTHWAYLTPPK